MSNNASTTTVTNTPNPPITPTKQELPRDDAQSIASETSTLYESKDKKSKEKEKKKATKLGDTFSSFAKKAKEEGWSAPTPTRPSFGA